MFDFFLKYSTYPLYIGPCSCLSFHFYYQCQQKDVLAFSVLLLIVFAGTVDCAIFLNANLDIDVISRIEHVLEVDGKDSNALF